MFSNKTHTNKQDIQTTKENAKEINKHVKFKEIKQIKEERKIIF